MIILAIEIEVKMLISPVESNFDGIIILEVYPSYSMSIVATSTTSSNYMANFVKLTRSTL